MLYSITGIITAHTAQSIVCKSDKLSFELQVPTPALFGIGHEHTVYTYLHWNADQGPSLFGFATETEKTIFLLVISISGVGPKLGLAMLQHMTPEEIIRNISSHDEKALSAVPGIGVKKAEQIIVALKHKVEKLLDSGVDFGEHSSVKQWNELTQALTSLNYSRPEISKAVTHVREISDSKATFDQLLRKALSYLSKPNL